ncbi:MAG: PTS system mannose/fructose/sorbose family transporter subunit IID [Deltaproteobacteria bacterium]|nr:PTS system mannose/fructose/sorbose family transporter subunit IID [Deltaproteobacteria bacterium]
MGYISSAFFRSFLIQSSWSFERMQSLGFFYSIVPAIRAIHKTEDKFKEACRRHLEFFNTNPYMAPAIIGATIRLEEDGASDDDIKGLKSALMGAYGALGDSLFWSSLRPLAAVCGIIFALLGFVWAPCVFLVVYNLPHIFIRGYGMIMGHKMGIGIVSVIMLLDIPGKAQSIKKGILFLSGFLLSVLLFIVSGRGEGGGSYLWVSLIVICSVFGFYLGLEKGIRVEVLAFTAVVVSVVLGMFL